MFHLKFWSNIYMPKTKKKNDGEIVINLDNFAIPIAIVLAGLLIIGLIGFVIYLIWQLLLMKLFV